MAVRLGTISLCRFKFHCTAYIEQAPHRSYAMQWNLNLQREIVPNLTAMLGYVGSRGVHLPYRTDDVDMVIPTRTSAGYLWPASVATPINPNFGSIRGMLYQGNSFYNALQLQITKRLSRGVQLQGAYTWGKSIDTNSGPLAGDQFGT